MSSRYETGSPRSVSVLCALAMLAPLMGGLGGCGTLPVEDKPVSRPEVTRSSVASSVPAPERSQKGEENGEMMWIWISPEQRHHMPPNTAEYLVEEVRR